MPISHLSLGETFTPCYATNLPKPVAEAVFEKRAPLAQASSSNEWMPMSTFRKTYRYTNIFNYASGERFSCTPRFNRFYFVVLSILTEVRGWPTVIKAH